MNLPSKNPDFIQSLIPQRTPIVMVDALLAYSATHLVAGLTVAPTNIFVKEQVFTEPGVIEHMAQAVALHTGYQYFLKNQEAPTGYIGAINKATIHQLPKIADELQTTVTIIQEFLGVTLVDIKTISGNVCIAEAQLKTVIAS